ncbi:MAG: hypothetical protein ACXW4P_03935 [Thermoanaerobaculia bacterium]
MLGNRRLGEAVLAVGFVLSMHSLNAQDADAGRRPDGTYSARMRAGSSDSRRATFVQRGSKVTGFVDVWVVYCFQGTLNGDVIDVQQARERQEDKMEEPLPRLLPVPYRLLPVPPQSEYMFRSLKITGPVVPAAPTGIEGGREGARSWDGNSADLLDGCLKYFSIATEPPCDDPELRATVPTAGTEPTYPPSRTTVCVISDEPQKIGDVLVPGSVCSVDAVFEVMSTTPAAIGPLNEDGRKQVVTDCGALSLESTITPNMIRTQIDAATHRVTNSTLRGHIFYPGQVMRQIVETDGRVEVLTIGHGSADPITKGLNRWHGPGIWEKVDEELLRAFAKSMTSRTAEGYKRNELHDGTYIAQEQHLYGAMLQFRKRGDHVVGLYRNMGGSQCYHGTITPTEIHVKDVVRREEDYATKVVTFGPIFESDRHKFTPLQFVPSPEPFPNPWALLGWDQHTLAKTVKRLDECSRHYGLPEEEPPPCGDDALKGAPRIGEMRDEFSKSDVVCEMTRTNGCTADNILALMLKTPGALATVMDANAAVQDCGTLAVRIPGGGERQVRLEVDSRYRVVSMYTLPGHPFFPTTIVRRIEASVGYVRVHTYAWGTGDVHKKVLFADAAASLVWKGPNKALKDAFSGTPVSAKSGTAPKKKQ